MTALLDIDEGTDENAQWSGYNTALGNYLADSLIVSLGRSMKALATILKAAKNKPIIKTNVVLQSKVLADSLSKRVIEVEETGLQFLIIFYTHC